MKINNLAVLGTGSDVGKSIVAAAILRSLVDKGLSAAPFKAQNMSNNSGITPEGLEMGRAQIVQAEAAKITPHVEMNPILLKPTGEKQSQVVLHGNVQANHTAMDYHKKKDFYFQQACKSFKKLQNRYDTIVLEGAGSCAEVNLMANDIVNFPMAEYAKADVILVADIHRGGVFGQIVGTLECLPEKYRNMIKGFIINRFRGDIALFKDGVSWIEEKTGKKVFGVLPWYSHFKIDAEDSVEVESCVGVKDLKGDKPAIGIIRLPHISNFTDFHVLSKITSIDTVFIDSPAHLEKLDVLIIPGSKNTRADLEWVKQIFKGTIKTFHDQNKHILGICGGYQILGKYVDDPDGLEGEPGRTKGIDLLPVVTVLKAPKTTTLSDFNWDGAKGRGYEIHMGYTQCLDAAPLLSITKRNGLPCQTEDGCVSNDKTILGTYIHGFFDEPSILEKWFDLIGLSNIQLSEQEGLSSKETD
ncbi:MAG: cobyric acid synthase, partial [Desulfobacteraceae bacterium]|nr:cobyric acid synthase [Desulfobacteraceae bacterium]